jgi:shikimate kinase
MTNPYIFNFSSFNSKKNNLFYLIGFSGSGKSTIAKELASKLNFNCFDIDTIFEINENQLISNIFNTLGEEYFRKAENNILKEVSKESNAIIACGGGITDNLENIEIMKQSGYIIWIYSDFEDCINRINLENKPMFNSFENYYDLFRKRGEDYFISSDLIVYNSKDLSNIINKIYAEINNII